MAIPVWRNRERFFPSLIHYMPTAWRRFPQTSVMHRIVCLVAVLSLPVSATACNGSVRGLCGEEKETEDDSPSTQVLKFTAQAIDYPISFRYLANLDNEPPPTNSTPPDPPPPPVVEDPPSEPPTVAEPIDPPPIDPPFDYYYTEPDTDGPEDGDDEDAGASSVPDPEPLPPPIDPFPMDSPPSDPPPIDPPPIDPPPIEPPPLDPEPTEPSANPDGSGSSGAGDDGQGDGDISSAEDTVDGNDPGELAESAPGTHLKYSSPEYRTGSKH